MGCKQAQAQPRPPTPSDDNSEAGDFENLEQDNEFGAKEDAHVHTSSRIELSNSSEATRNGSTPPSAQENGGFSRFPPSGEELRAIKDASDLYKSNSFKLQVCLMILKGRPILIPLVLLRLTPLSQIYDLRQRGPLHLNDFFLPFTLSLQRCRL